MFDAAVQPDGTIRTFMKGNPNWVVGVVGPVKMPRALQPAPAQKPTA